MVFLIVGKVLVLSETSERGRARFIAFITALLFAIHPINVESIAWISASKIPLYAFFYLLGLVAYIRYIETQKTTWYVAVLAAFALSFCSKEQAVTFPLCLLAIDWFLKRNLKGEQVWAEKITFVVLALFFGLITILAQGATSGDSAYPLWQRMLFSCYAIFEYITKSIIPLKLSYIYPFPMDAGSAIPPRFWIYPFLVAGMVSLLVMYRKNRLLMFCTLIFIIHLSLSLNIMSLGRNAMIADRYLYIGETGIFMFVAYALCEFHAKYKNKRKWLIITALLYSIYLGGYTFGYTQKWKDSDTAKHYIQDIADKRVKSDTDEAKEEKGEEEEKLIE
jgi:hypothetical protein